MPRKALSSKVSKKKTGKVVESRNAVKTIRKPIAKKAVGVKTCEHVKLSAESLEKSSRDLAATIDALHGQMNNAMAKLTELATIQSNQHKVVIRTAPIDRATATFQRIVAEVLDDHLAEMLPPLVSLRNEFARRAAEPQGEDDFDRRGCEALDHVLQLAGVHAFDPRIGEPLDPAIHTAVADVHRDDLAGGVVAEVVQSGFRTARGKVVTPAKVRVNRR